MNVSSLEVSFPRTFGKLDSALPEFKKINDAAYWDYERSRAYVRTEKSIKQKTERVKDKRRQIHVQKEVWIGETPLRCSCCQSDTFAVCREGAHVVYDIKFMKNGINVGLLDIDLDDIDARYVVSSCLNTSHCLYMVHLFELSSYI